LYRRRRRDGTLGDVLWCQYRSHGRKQPIGAVPFSLDTARAISGHKTESAHKQYVITQTTTKTAALAVMAEAVERGRQGLARVHSVDT
jgi:hypothetical protein